MRGSPSLKLPAVFKAIFAAIYKVRFSCFRGWEGAHNRLLHTPRALITYAITTVYSCISLFIDFCESDIELSFSVLTVGENRKSSDQHVFKLNVFIFLSAELMERLYS